MFMAQITAWDTPNDAKEFFDAYAERTVKRYPDAKAIEVDATYQRGTRQEWQTSTGRVVLELRGSGVLILEGVPAGTKTNTLVRLGWR